MSNKNIIVPIILAGGSGTRLWPLSRRSFPKQFLNLLDDEYTMLQRTYKRVENLENISRPIVICNKEHRFIVGHQMKEINVKPLEILLEPEGRNTTPAIAIAALKALNNFKDKNIDPILLILSSDHQIIDINKFQLSIENSINFALQDNLVIFGIPPTYPSTGYGYIKSEKQLDHNKYFPIKVDKFIEKPDKKTAKYFVKDKKYSWNSGMFVFKAKTILEEIDKYNPEIIKFCRLSLSKSNKDLDFQRLDKHYFSKRPNISIDFSVMEKTKKGKVVKLDAGWSDIGSWQALWQLSEKDTNGNYSSGNILIENAKNCYLRSENRLVVGIGLNELIVVETDDAILIAKNSETQRVKEIVKKLKTKNISEGQFHKKIYRPWGHYISLSEDKKWQVKLLQVNPGGKLSLQMHHHRSEHWVVVNGTAKVEINGEIKLLNKNQSTYIPLGAKHRLSNPNTTLLTIIEVQSGSYLGEDDIVRFEDVYGRNKNN